jgi:hypothetical protein
MTGGTKQNKEQVVEQTEEFIPSGKSEGPDFGRLKGRERSKAVGTRNLHRVNEERRSGARDGARLLVRRINIINAHYDRLVVSSYEHAREILAAVTRSVGRKEMTPQAGSTIVQAVKAAVSTLEAEKRTPDEKTMGMRFRTVLDESGNRTGEDAPASPAAPETPGDGPSHDG